MRLAGRYYCVMAVLICCLIFWLLWENVRFCLFIVFFYAHDIRSSPFWLPSWKEWISFISSCLHQSPMPILQECTSAENAAHDEYNAHKACTYQAVCKKLSPPLRQEAVPNSSSRPERGVWRCMKSEWWWTHWIFRPTKSLKHSSASKDASNAQVREWKRINSIIVEMVGLFKKIFTRRNQFSGFEKLYLLCIRQRVLPDRYFHNAIEPRSR